jgi:hypothetical protein
MLKSRSLSSEMENKKTGVITHCYDFELSHAVTIIIIERQRKTTIEFYDFMFWFELRQ